MMNEGTWVVVQDGTGGRPEDVFANGKWWRNVETPDPDLANYQTGYQHGYDDAAEDKGAGAMGASIFFAFLGFVMGFGVAWVILN